MYKQIPFIIFSLFIIGTQSQLFLNMTRYCFAKDPASETFRLAPANTYGQFTSLGGELLTFSTITTPTSRAIYYYPTYNLPNCIVGFNHPSPYTMPICEVKTSRGYFYHHCDISVMFQTTLFATSAVVTKLGYFLYSGAPLYPNTKYTAVISAYRKASNNNDRNPSIFMQTGVTYDAGATPNPWPTAQYSDYLNNVYYKLHEGNSNPEWSNTFFGLTDFPKVDYSGSSSILTDSSEFDGLTYYVDNCASSVELQYQITDSMMTESSKHTSINTAQSQSSTYTQNIQISTSVEASYGAASASTSFTIDFGSSSTSETSKSYGTDNTLTMSNDISSGATIIVPPYTQYKIVEKLKLSTTQKTHNIQIDNQQNNIVQDTKQIFPGGFRTLEMSCNPDRIFSNTANITSLLRSSIISRPSNKYFFTLQSDNNLVLSCAKYGLTGERKTMWSTNTGTGVPNSVVVYLQNDGNLVMYDSQGTVKWASSSGGVSPHSLYVKDDGKVVVQDKNGSEVWSTGTTASQC